MWQEEQIFMRGAIVYGDIYEDEDIIFGPAIIDAYHLERDEKKAVWPRILIDESLLKKTTKAELKRDFLEFLRQDDDELVYLDYLRELFHLFIVAEQKEIQGEREKDFGPPIELFKDHKEAILKQVYSALKEEDENESKKILRKYAELSKYHDSTIDKIRQVIKDLTNNYSLIREFYDDQIKASRARRSGSPYEPKFSAEEHPEQTDMLNVIGAVMNRIAKNQPKDIFQIRDIVIIGQTEEAKLERGFRILLSETPQELSKLDKDIQELMIDIDSFGLENNKVQKGP